jgi:hypothetical protein
LQRADAKVHQHTLHFLDARFVQRHPHLIKTHMQKLYGCAKRFQHFAGNRQRLRIPIQPNQTPPWLNSLSNRARMSSKADRRVNEDVPGRGPQVIQHFMK